MEPKALDRFMFCFLSWKLSKKLRKVGTSILNPVYLLPCFAHERTGQSCFIFFSAEILKTILGGVLGQVTMRKRETL